ncbi:efflux RND transporter periplasmic adaptor subunit [Psychrobium sp. 1_MG-2023]|uniref:efflux RND transporter periplasmic adaptor subunit n=1 Tax=Psychrobium sp. 1_MG-2023 TaxID=3062624 RepID=UPI000C348E15|nr:efflux RND transporter periplasmic adaptor subunit [Psychrobium sp. 1_MG-2023]MDP2560666.1 efflux RND transporter periplasmic adaptor subunit [Psychrobium sp. 1_MG-2023]PKF56562.1 efflux RND transporter periplasmic adaptor subunit [Alteromonadales bacterium alter-6D02]
MNKYGKFAQALCAATFCAVTVAGCGQQEKIQDAQPPLRPVKTVVLESFDNAREYEFTAVVDAARKADLSFKVSGELSEFLVKQGDFVKQGQVIAKLNDTDIAIQLKSAQSSFDKAKSDFDRAKQLIKTSYISKAEFEQLRAAFNGAQAQLDSAKNNLAYTTLHASFSGVIAKKYTERYQEISAKSAIVRLHDISQVKLIVNIPESMMIRLRKDTNQGQVYAAFNSIEGKRFPLTFSEVATLADEQTKTYEVTFTMAAVKEHSILPGMTATVLAQINIPDATEPSFYLPANTVLKDNNNHYVYVVSRQSEGVGKVSKKIVTIGDITPLGIEVYTGLAEGDAVITAGMSKVSNGLLVKF